MDGLMLTNRSAVDRSKTDFYETPEACTVALLDFLEQKVHLIAGEDRIWECACGDGKMARVMEGRGYSVVGTDLHDMAYGESGVDFLKASRECECIITNPPFSIAGEFIKHALELHKPCAFLLKSQFWHARSRLELFQEHTPTYILPLTWRPDFLYGRKSGSPTMECIWTVWAGECAHAKYIPLGKPVIE